MTNLTCVWRDHYVLPAAVHILKLEQYRKYWHDPCMRMTHKFMTHSMFLWLNFCFYSHPERPRQHREGLAASTCPESGATTIRKWLQKFTGSFKPKEKKTERDYYEDREMAQQVTHNWHMNSQMWWYSSVVPALLWWDRNLPDALLIAEMRDPASKQCERSEPPLGKLPSTSTWHGMQVPILT